MFSYVCYIYQIFVHMHVAITYEQIDDIAISH